MATNKSTAKRIGGNKDKTSSKPLSPETFLEIKAFQVKLNTSIAEAYKKKAEEIMKLLSVS